MAQKFIVDCDPGLDDIFALFFLLLSGNEYEVELITTCHGNCSPEDGLRNVVTCFDVLAKESSWRSINKCAPLNLSSKKPVIAKGASTSLTNDTINNYYHGLDGICGKSTAPGNHTPIADWQSHFSDKAPKEVCPISGFIPSSKPAHLEILRILKENEPNTVKICALGPLTNLALAAEADLETFCRLQELVVVGGTLDGPGNVTATSESNTFADPVAAAKIYSTTSTNTKWTTPKGYAPFNVKTPTSITLIPCNLGNRHRLPLESLIAHSEHLLLNDSPMASWLKLILSGLSGNGCGVKFGLQLHDPLAVWYAMTEDREAWVLEKNVDLRVETEGHYCKGMCIIDRRIEFKVYKEEEANINGDTLKIQGVGNKLNIVKDCPSDDKSFERFENIILSKFFAV